MDPVKLSQEFIRFNTTTSNENEIKFAKYIIDLFAMEDFNCEILKDGNHANLIITYGKDPDLIFSGHMDTVDCATEEWSFDPFKPFIKDEKLYGLGSCDMKSGLACIIAAVMNNRHKMKKGVKMIFTYDEENGFTGIRTIPKKEFKGKYCVIAEPSNSIPVNAHKGVTRMLATIHGKSAHGSRPERGINAIQKMFDFEFMMSDMNTRIMKKDHEILGFPAFNIGIIKGGQETNIVPARCDMWFEYRLTPEFNYQYLKKNMSKLVYSFSRKHPRSKLEVDVIFNIPSFFNMKPTPFKKTILEMCKRETFDHQRGATEAPFYAVNGLDTLILGPGALTLHQANEWVYLDQIRKCEKYYEKLIKAFC